MASTATPYGFRPVQMLGSRAMSHGFKQYKIASGYATNIFTGDLVKMAATGGTIEKETGTTTAVPVGVFMGVEYTSAPLNYLLHRMYWPASTVASDAMGYVCDDPDVLFQVQASGTLAATSVGSNIAITQGSGSTTTGMSAVSITYSTAASTNTLPIRIVDFVNKSGTSTIGDAYTDMIVRINTHFHRAILGVAPA